MVHSISIRNSSLSRPCSNILLLVLIIVNQCICHCDCWSFLPTPPAVSRRTTTTTRTSSYYSQFSHHHATTRLFLSESESADASANDASNNNGGIDLSIDERLYKLRLPRALGIDWGTDLSFSFVYVRDMEPSGAAAMSGKINVNDQLCEITPVVVDANQPKPIPVNLIGAPFDFVMNQFACLDRNAIDVDLVFFKGTKDELKAACEGGKSDGTASSNEPETITVTVIQNKGKADETATKLSAKPGINILQLLADNNINVYQSITRYTNCKGKQLCGTCIVNVSDGGQNTNRKSMDEESTLRENSDSYRLSCIAFAYGDCTVETLPPINAAQWTR